LIELNTEYFDVIYSDYYNLHITYIFYCSTNGYTDNYTNVCLVNKTNLVHNILSIFRQFYL